MHVLGIDGSGRTGGNTSVLVRGFLQGAQDAGATATFAELGTLNLRGCTACKACKDSREKVCIIQDDMQQFYDLLADIDVLFLASPIYLDHLTAQLMTFIQRLYCYLSPSLRNHWPRSGVDFVAGITYGAGNPTMYDYVLEWMQARMAFYFDIHTIAAFKIPSCSHVSIIDDSHPVVKEAYATGAALGAPVSNLTTAL